MKIRKYITNTLLNLPGWHTNRKIVVIESDDWGSIRMPSKEIYNDFLNIGIRVDKDPYCRYDSLARPDDFDALFEVLQSVKDKNGKPAIITANTLVANPDFDKIKTSDFREYHFELFTKTLKRNKQTEKSFDLWQEGMQAGIFHPQFHGREHLNINKWLRYLKEGEEITRLAFDMGTFGLTPTVDPRSPNYMGAFNSALKEDIQRYNNILTEGLKLFEDIFNYKSLSFIPTTHTWPLEIEPTLKENGVKYLQGMVMQKIPLNNDTDFRFKRNNFTGRKSKAGLIYISRNAYFEPSVYPTVDWVNECLRRVKIAFFMKKPFVIGSHRLNFIGAIDEKNRTQNLMGLKRLLKQIVNDFPNVEFMTTDQVGELIR